MMPDHTRSPRHLAVMVLSVLNTFCHGSCHGHGCEMAGWQSYEIVDEHQMSANVVVVNTNIGLEYKVTN